MSKWKCEICNKEFENFHAQGFNNKIYCPLCYFKKENKELKERIDKAIEEIQKELKENHHLSYGVALSVISILDGYKFLEGDK